MAGGLSYERSEFNRVTQARRQPGSAFKPFVYLAGLDSGFTPATMILDAPFVRSEEHTSELQSLMRNSYAVFCLKKNTQQIQIPHLHALPICNTPTTTHIISSLGTPY